MPQGIAQQVAQDLGQPVGIARHRRQRVGCVQRKLHARGLRHGCELRHRRARQSNQVHRQAFQAQLPRIRQREVVQVIHESGQQPRFIVQAGDLRHLQRVDPVQQRLEVALHYGQRRAQLMTGICEKIRTHPLSANSRCLIVKNQHCRAIGAPRHRRHVAARMTINLRRRLILDSPASAFP